LPFIDGDPSRVEQYAPPGHWPFAPPGLLSALLFGCGFVGSPDVPAVPDVLCDFAVDPPEDDEAVVCVDFELDACVVFEEDEEPVDLLDEPVDFVDEACVDFVDDACVDFDEEPVDLVDEAWDD
jgi:hypothetical protein